MTEAADDVLQWQSGRDNQLPRGKPRGIPPTCYPERDSGSSPALRDLFAASRVVLDPEKRIKMCTFMSEFSKEVERGQANSGLDEDSASKIHRDFLRKKYHSQGPEQGPSSIDTEKIYDGLFEEHRQLIDKQIKCGQLRLEALQSFARQLGMKEKTFPESLPDMRSENTFLKKIRTVFDAQTDHFNLASLHELQKAATDYASMRADQKEIHDMIDELFIRMKNSGVF
jgi:hypothetical protein